MLAVGRQKCRRAGARRRIALVEAASPRLPFPDDTVQIVSVAFGLRNFSDTDAGLREMARVCRPGGRVAVFEFSMPPAWPLGPFTVGTSSTPTPPHRPGTRSEHSSRLPLLPQSVGHFPQGEALAERMRKAGLGEVWFRPFTCGVIVRGGEEGLGARQPSNETAKRLFAHSFLIPSP